ncbi:neutral/alkaline non-lysosomal ceramidase N-terminal domain-containing protein [uncultured Cyclobacterium sp.]|uniref:neutral/alkaline non-lysosomal ceramidase N-terminal domain-containing protein n=1 Tax=uncultured Cyclobacterium sp. TaxID=453820 RepID=UPI0030ED2815|tara:strand:+ start:141331 stop:142719 length:1389 start_codon:yes stop_codon:yes gene_type:complete
MKSFILSHQQILFTALLFICMSTTFQGFAQKSNTWKTGTAKINITPKSSLWMAGYGHRDHTSEGKYGELWVKVLALEDAKGYKTVIVTSDLLGLPKNLSDGIRNSAIHQFGLQKSQIVLNSSHTHSAPVLGKSLFDIYPMNSQQRNDVEKYTDNLQEEIVKSIGKALSNMKPSKVYSNNGTARFQVNRRNNKESEVHLSTNLNGPMDHAVPVLKVLDENDQITTVLFGYACHPTVLSGYEWSGDYPGYAQEVVEKNYPGAMAMFFQGAGGDQNPLPRRTLPLAKQYGTVLAATVERVLSEEMKPLEADLGSAYTEIDLALEEAPSKAELNKIINEQSGYMKRWAERMLREIEAGNTLPSSYPFPVQIIKMGNQSIFTMGGEVTIGYANKLKEKYGPDIFVMTYTNDVMSYIPTEIVLKEGGYEGHTAQMVYGLPSKWKTGLEAQILSAFDGLASKLAIHPTK